jgi:hypothetical protein
VIVVDASALLEFLLQTSLGARVEARLFRDDDELHALTSWTSRYCKAFDVSCGAVKSRPAVPTKRLRI